MPEEDRQTDAPRYASLSDYLRVFNERWRLIAGVAIGFTVAAFAYSAFQPKTYEAVSTLTARQPGADLGLIGSSAGPPVSPGALTAELAALAERDSIAKRVSRSLDASLTPGQIAARVSASIDIRTNLVLLTAESRDPQLAARLVNEYATQVEKEALLAQRDQIEAALGLVRRQLKEAKRGEVVPNSSDEVVILQERFNRLQTLNRIATPAETVTAATVPGTPVSPRLLRNTALGLLAGLFLGVVAAFVRDSLDNRLKTPKEIEEHFGLERIGQLTDSAFARSALGQNGKRRLDPADVEAARIMRANLDFLDRDDSLRSLVVTSPLPGEGKSTVAVALAWASAVAGRRTLLVECDLRQSALAERLALRRAPGLSDVLLGNVRPKDVLQAVDLEVTGTGNGEASAPEASRLICITAGTPIPNPAELLGSAAFSEFLQQVTGVYGLVVLDTSPMLSVADTRELLPLVDGVVLCARSYQTTRQQALATRATLEHASTPLTGLVVTGVRPSDDDYFAYYHRYAHAPPPAVD